MHTCCEVCEVYDLLVKGGVAVDPSHGLHAPRDIAITRGIIEAVEKDISSDQAREVIDASGLLVTPGLIDIHVHVYPGVSHYGLDADTHSLAQGVTTVLDAGSAGADTFDGFRRYVVNVSDTRIYALLNISTLGMISPRVGELEDLRYADVERAVDIIERNRDVIQGVKVRMSRNVVGENGMDSHNPVAKLHDPSLHSLSRNPQSFPWQLLVLLTVQTIADCWSGTVTSRLVQSVQLATVT